MQVFFNFNLEKLKEFIEQTAKYQKVMLVYDNSVNSCQINDIYEAIKPVCVFNRCHFNLVDEEIYNGYKSIIFMCSADAFLSLNLCLDEFNCAFIPTDNSITCFYKYNTNKNCIFLNPVSFDISLVTSAVFNEIFTYLSCLSNGQDVDFNMPQLNSVTQQGLLDFFNHFNNKFLDFEILQFCKLNYDCLPLIDIVLIDGLKMLFNNFLTNKIQYVDFYKAIKNEPNLIDKFYALTCGNTLKIAMEYNHVNIKLAFNEIDAVLNKIDKCFFNIEKSKIENILKNLKNYTKNCTNLLSNLYLFNFFGV